MKIYVVYGMFVEIANWEITSGVYIAGAYTNEEDAKEAFKLEKESVSDDEQLIVRCAQVEVDKFPEYMGTNAWAKYPMKDVTDIFEEEGL